MTKITITKVVKNDTNKAGEPYIGKNGKPYSRASIKTEEHGDEWLGGFWSSDLKVGAQLEAEISEREYNGKTYKDFKLPKKTTGGSPEVMFQLGKMDAKLDKLTFLVNALGDRLEKVLGMSDEPDDIEMPDFSGVKSEDSPF